MKEENRTYICPTQPCKMDLTHSSNVSIPITIAPFSKIGTIETKCCNEPIITLNSTDPSGEINSVCNFIITQKVCVKIPVEFGANTTIGATYVECLGVEIDKDNCL